MSGEGDRLGCLRLLSPQEPSLFVFFAQEPSLFPRGQPILGDSSMENSMVRGPTNGQTGLRMLEAGERTKCTGR